jgi:hypothetical protein
MAVNGRSRLKRVDVGEPTGIAGPANDMPAT